MPTLPVSFSDGPAAASARCVAAAGCWVKRRASRRAPPASPVASPADSLLPHRNQRPAAATIEAQRRMLGLVLIHLRAGAQHGSRRLQIPHGRKPFSDFVCVRC